MTEITRTCGLHFATVSRLLDSLILEGLIERDLFAAATARPAWCKRWPMVISAIAG